MPSDAGTLSHDQSLLDRANAGSDEARAALIEACCGRLLQLAQRMLHRRFPELRRWEDTDDVFQQAWLRLQRSLGKVKPESVGEFYGLAATEIRRELIDLCRRHFGPQGVGANHESDWGGGPASGSDRPRHDPREDTGGPASCMAWAEFHEQAGMLPEQERQVFDLLWYQQLSQEEAAAVAGVSVRTVKRRWQRAKLQLFKACGGQPPG